MSPRKLPNQVCLTYSLRRRSHQEHQTQGLPEHSQVHPAGHLSAELICSRPPPLTVTQRPAAAASWLGWRGWGVLSIAPLLGQVAHIYESGGSQPGHSLVSPGRLLKLLLPVSHTQRFWLNWLGVEAGLGDFLKAPNVMPTCS